MYRNYVFSDATEALPHLLNDLLTEGSEVGSRNGRVKELTHVGITLADPARRELLVDQRNPNLAAQIAETAWVLSGENDIGWLGHYLPRAKDFSDDGQTWRAGYGPRLRAWNKRWTDEVGEVGVDQLAHVVKLLRDNPLDRRAVISLWDPMVDTTPGKDIACNNWLSFSSRLGSLDLHVAIRSNDVIWGWSGINAFEWSALLEIVAGLLGLQVGSLHFSITSLHLYEQHWNRAQKIVDYHDSTVQLNERLLQPSPAFDASVVNYDLEEFDRLVHQWFLIEKAIRNGDPAESAVERFPEPMLQSWLRVLQWWWTGEREYLAALEGTRLEASTFYSVQPPERELVPVYSAQSPKPVATYRVDKPTPDSSDFIKRAIALHNEKHAAYGDSWKRRGEMISILANIARKIDRLGGAETADETSVDTAMDLMIYLAKYRVWLDVYANGTPHDVDRTDFPDAANDLLVEIERGWTTLDMGWEKYDINVNILNDELPRLFDQLERAVQDPEFDAREDVVDQMLHDSYLLARELWERTRKLDKARAEERDRALQGLAPAKASGISISELEDEYHGADAD